MSEDNTGTRILTKEEQIVFYQGYIEGMKFILFTLQEPRGKRYQKATKEDFDRLFNEVSK